MELETVYALLGSALVGGLAAAGAAALWWGGQIKAAAGRIATLEQSRQSAKDDNGQLRKEIERLQHQLNELRIDAMRARPRAETAAATRQEAEDLLLRATPPAPQEPFPATVIVPRPQQAEFAEAPFPATQVLPRKP